MVPGPGIHPDPGHGVKPISDSPADLFDIAGKVACVTGAGSGLGQAFARTLRQAGASVVGVGRRKTALDEWLAGDLTGEAAAVVADLSDLAALDSVAEAICAPFGPPQILVNAAGINLRQAAEDVSLQDWQQTLDTNLSAPFFLARAMVPGMQTTGWGRIVNIASLQSSRAFANGMAYGASKGGVVQLTRAMAEAWSARGINANALAPGFFPTALTRPVFDDTDRAEAEAARTCTGRNGTMQDLTGPLLFLCSPASDYVTGQVLYVDGGYTAR